MACRGGRRGGRGGHGAGGYSVRAAGAALGAGRQRPALVVSVSCSACHWRQPRVPLAVKVHETRNPCRGDGDDDGNGGAAVGRLPFVTTFAGTSSLTARPTLATSGCTTTTPPRSTPCLSPSGSSSEGGRREGGAPSVTACLSGEQPSGHLPAANSAQDGQHGSHQTAAVCVCDGARQQGSAARKMHVCAPSVSPSREAACVPGRGVPAPRSRRQAPL